MIGFVILLMTLIPVLDIPHSGRARIEPVTPLNFISVPVRINSTTADCSSVVSYVDYSISNNSGDDINIVELEVYSVDPNGKFSKLDTITAEDLITAGSTQNGRLTLEPVDSRSRLVLTLKRAVTNSGLWVIDGESINTALRNLSKNELSRGGKFFPNLIVTNSDQEELFQMALSNILQDPAKKEKLQNQKRLIFSDQGLYFNTKDSSDTSILRPEDIQEIAEREGRVLYLNFRPLTIQGSQVFAKITLREALPRQRRIASQYKYAYGFVFVKGQDHWVISKSIVYAQD
ncbi:MAG TPA: hypothetical protein VI306_08525 [Pyrinomonadaceae bacterium]